MTVNNLTTAKFDCNSIQPEHFPLEIDTSSIATSPSKEEPTIPSNVTHKRKTSQSEYLVERFDDSHCNFKAKQTNP